MKVKKTSNLNSHTTDYYDPLNVVVVILWQKEKYIYKRKEEVRFYHNGSWILKKTYISKWIPHTTLLYLLGQEITTILLEEIKGGKVPLKNCATHFPNYKKGII